MIQQVDSVNGFSSVVVAHINIRFASLVDFGAFPVNFTYFTPVFPFPSIAHFLNMKKCSRGRLLDPLKMYVKLSMEDTIRPLSLHPSMNSRH